MILVGLMAHTHKNKRTHTHMIQANSVSMHTRVYLYMCARTRAQTCVCVRMCMQVRTSVCVLTVCCSVAGNVDHHPHPKFRQALPEHIAVVVIIARYQLTSDILHCRTTVPDSQAGLSW